VAAGLAAGAADAAGAGAGAGAAAGAAAGFAAGAAAVAGAGVDFAFEVAAGVAAGAAAVVPAAGVAESAVLDFLDLDDVLDVEALLSAAAGADDAVAVESVFLLFVDLLLQALVLAGAALSAVASAFFDFEDFLVVEESSAAALLSAVSDFLLFVDFLVVEVSVVEVSAVVLFFFFDFVVLGALWSVDGVGGVVAAGVWAWSADAGSNVRFPSSSTNAATNKKYNRLRVRFIIR